MIVRFSDDDLRSHERGYPALLALVDGPITLRYHRIDTVWLTVLHELIHVRDGHAVIDVLNEDDGTRDIPDERFTDHVGLGSSGPPADLWRWPRRGHSQQRMPIAAAGYSR
jgi:hypothetical protein